MNICALRMIWILRGPRANRLHPGHPLGTRKLADVRERRKESHRLLQGWWIDATRGESEQPIDCD